MTGSINVGVHEVEVERAVIVGLGVERGMINTEGLFEGVMEIKVVTAPGTPLTLEVGTGTGIFTNEGLAAVVMVDLIVVTEGDEVQDPEMVVDLEEMNEGQVVMVVVETGVGGANMVKVVSLQKISIMQV